MEVLAGAGFAGVNGVVKAVTGKSILQHCGIAVNRLRANVLGIGAEYMGHALADKAADKAWKAAEAKLAGPDRDERLRFSCRLEALSDVLQSVASSRAVEDDSVKTALDNLRSSLERAFKAAGSDDGRRSSEADIDSYKQNLQQVFAAANAKRAEESHDDIREIREMLATEDSFKYDPYDSDSDQEASLLGEGSFGATHTMRNVDDGHLYAVKLIKIKKAGVPIESLRQEASRLAKLNHPNIVRYYTSFTKKKFFAIIKRWTIQIASALAHMHARACSTATSSRTTSSSTRADARASSTSGSRKIVVAKSKVSSKNAVGAELYRSPEKALGRAYDAKDDIWALGCMVAGGDGKSLRGRERERRWPLRSTQPRQGDVGPLVALLRTGADGAKEQARRLCDANLALNADNKVAIAKAGAVDPLVALLRTGTDGAKETPRGLCGTWL
ncbi:protein serine/threonine kinase [Aureococcus anophagefferens]|uniref:non-specific serine/threonine protein kinase n=1 Tax=Aureococcus anophagefferens TaxID=44056 RepID=A0ABR1G0J8_AURAN